MTAISGRCSGLAAVIVVVLAAACGTTNEQGQRSSPSDRVDVAAPAVPEVPRGPAPTTTVASTVTSTTTTGTSAPTTTLPGTPIDDPFIPAGAVLGVVGIAFDDDLTVHALPGPDQPVVGTLPSLALNLVALGRAQLVAPAEVYREVSADGVTGWVDSDHALYVTGPTDITASVVAELGGTPSAPSILELGRTVVDALGPPPDAPSRVLVVVAKPTTGPTAEVTFDEFFGEEFGDDSVAGSRYRVVGRQIAAGNLPETGFASAVEYELVRVDQIGICWRGATDDGLCV